MAYVQGKSALQRGATVAGPGVNHRSVIISADAKGLLPLGVIKVKSPEFQEWLRHEVTASGDLNLTVQIDNTRASSVMVPQSDPGPYLTSGTMKNANKSSTATFYKPSQIKEIFDKLDRVSVEYNTTNGNTYWYGPLEDVNLYRATLDSVKGYIIRPGTIQKQDAHRDITNIGLKQFNATCACKDWCIKNRDEALARRPDLVSAKFMKASMLPSEAALLQEAQELASVAEDQISKGDEPSL